MAKLAPGGASEEGGGRAVSDVPFLSSISDCCYSLLRVPRHERSSGVDLVYAIEFILHPITLKESQQVQVVHGNVLTARSNLDAFVGRPC